MPQNPNHGTCARCGDSNPYTAVICAGCGSRLPWADALTARSTTPTASAAPPAATQANQTTQADADAAWAAWEAQRQPGQPPLPPVPPASPAMTPPMAQATPSHYSRTCAHCGAGMSVVMQICPTCRRSNQTPVQHPVTASAASRSNNALAGAIVGFIVLMLVVQQFLPVRPARGPATDPAASGSGPGTPAARRVTGPARPIPSPTVAVVPTVTPTIPASRVPRAAPPREPGSDAQAPVAPPARGSYTISASAVVDEFSQSIRAASTLDEINTVSMQIAQLSSVIQNQKRMDERQWKWESVRVLTYYEAVMMSLADAANQRRNQLLGSRFLNSIEHYLAAARSSAQQCPGTITIDASQLQ